MAPDPANIAARFLAHASDPKIGASITLKANAWQGGAIAADTPGFAVQTKSDPDRLAAANLVLRNPVALMIAAKDLAADPTPGVIVTFRGTDYTIALREPFSVGGVDIYHRVEASA